MCERRKRVILLSGCWAAAYTSCGVLGGGGGQRLVSQRQRGQDYPICSDTPKRWAWSLGLMQKAYQKAGSGILNQSLMISLKLAMISLKCNKNKKLISLTVATEI